MPHTLSHNAYGKAGIRLTKVTRLPDRHEIFEASVAIELEGDFDRSYTHGDNSLVIATDTMKNTVYALAAQHAFESIEQFGQILAKHFLSKNTHVRQARVTLAQTPFQRISVDGESHQHAFVGSGSERRTATVTASRQRTAVQGGIDGLLILKTTGSGFEGYLRDRYTTLKETNDRIFATTLTAEWTCSTAATDYNALHARARQAMLKVFAVNFSHAVQQTLLEMGQAALDACAEIEQITLVMPNKHRIAVNLEPLGLTNSNEIFITTDEPYGLITGTVKRG